MGAFAEEEDEVDGDEATRTMDSHKYTDTSLQASVTVVQFITLEIGNRFVQEIMISESILP